MGGDDALKLEDAYHLSKSLPDSSRLRSTSLNDFKGKADVPSLKSPTAQYSTFAETFLSTSEMTNVISTLERKMAKLRERLNRSEEERMKAEFRLQEKVVQVHKLEAEVASLKSQLDCERKAALVEKEAFQLELKKLKNSRLDAEQILSETTKEELTGTTPIIGVSSRFADTEKELLHKKLAVALSELSILRDSYRNQSLVLSECEKKLEEALTDKAEAISSKVDALLVQSRFNLTWIPENATDECLQCRAKFSFFSRPRHCRCCGRLFCASCASHESSIPWLGFNEPVRLCDYCFVLVLAKKSGRDVDPKAMEYQQVQDQLLKKFEAWDDYRRNMLFENLISKSSLVQLCYLYKILSETLDNYKLWEKERGMEAEHLLMEEQMAGAVGGINGEGLRFDQKSYSTLSSDS